MPIPVPRKCSGVSQSLPPRERVLSPHLPHCAVAEPVAEPVAETTAEATVDAVMDTMTVASAAAITAAVATTGTRRPASTALKRRSTR